VNVYVELRKLPILFLSPTTMHISQMIAFFSRLSIIIFTSLLFNTHQSLANSYVEIGANWSQLALDTQPAIMVERHGLLALNTQPAIMVERHGLLACNTQPAIMVERHGLLALNTRPAIMVGRHGPLALDAQPTIFVERHSRLAPDYEGHSQNIAHTNFTYVQSQELNESHIDYAYIQSQELSEAYIDYRYVQLDPAHINDAHVQMNPAHINCTYVQSNLAHVNYRYIQLNPTYVNYAYVQLNLAHFNYMYAQSQRLKEIQVQFDNIIKIKCKILYKALPSLSSLGWMILNVMLEYMHLTLPHILHNCILTYLCLDDAPPQLCRALWGRFQRHCMLKHEYRNLINNILRLQQSYKLTSCFFMFSFTLQFLLFYMSVRSIDVFMMAGYESWLRVL
jgi:uncharacterized protein YjbI with pentapeptide repeats